MKNLMMSFILDEVIFNAIFSLQQDQIVLKRRTNKILLKDINNRVTLQFLSIFNFFLLSCYTHFNFFFALIVTNFAFFILFHNCYECAKEKKNLYNLIFLLYFFSHICIAIKCLLGFFLYVQSILLIIIIIIIITSF
jgi:hypothetical protein